MSEELEGWPLWKCVLVTALLFAIPFLLVLGHPVAATIGWAAVTALYLLSLLVFGDGHVIEGAVAGLIQAVLVAATMALVFAHRDHAESSRVVRVELQEIRVACNRGALPRVRRPPNPPLQPTSGGRVARQSGTLRRPLAAERQR